MGRYVTTTYRLHELQVCVIGGYVPTRHVRFIELRIEIQFFPLD